MIQVVSRISVSETTHREMLHQILIDFTVWIGIDDHHTISNKVMVVSVISLQTHNVIYFINDAWILEFEAFWGIKIYIVRAQYRSKLVT